MHYSNSFSVPATEVKNEFARVLERVVKGGTAVITRHDRPTAVMLSIEEYESMTGSQAIDLEKLTKECDELLAEMQKPGVRAAMDAAFHASPQEMGRAAVAATKKRAR